MVPLSQLLLTRGSVSKLCSTESSLNTLLTGLCLLLLVGQAVGAGGDCMSGTAIDCFECNSWDDARCHDPWNWTYPKDTMPPTRECEGCCVKMVQFIGTEHYQIRRTCTDQLEINFFMVNHGCMTEGHRHGHMCFCEEDQCNAASSRFAQGVITSLSLSLLPLILRWWSLEEWSVSTIKPIFSLNLIFHEYCDKLISLFYIFMSLYFDASISLLWF